MSIQIKDGEIINDGMKMNQLKSSKNQLKSFSTSVGSTVVLASQLSGKAEISTAKLIKLLMEVKKELKNVVEEIEDDIMFGVEG